MTHQDLQQFKADTDSMETSSVSCSLATHFLVIWQENLNIANLGQSVETGDETDRVTVSPYVCITYPPGDIIPKDALPDELKSVELYKRMVANGLRPLQKGDVLMVKTQYKTDDIKLDIEGIEYYGVPLEAVVGRIDFESGELETFNEYNIVELNEAVDFNTEYNTLKASRYDKASAIGLVKFGNYRGHRVAFKPSISTEHPLFALYPNTVRVHDEEILFYI